MHRMNLSDHKTFDQQKLQAGRSLAELVVAEQLLGAGHGLFGCVHP